MPQTDSPASDAAHFEPVDDAAVDASVLIEGLPGHGLVASIAVDHVSRQLGLEHAGNITSDAFPPAITFKDGLVRDLVRVYAGDSPSVMTLQSDLALPGHAFGPLAQCVIEELAPDVDKAIFLAGAPADSEAQLGTIRGVATTPALRDDLEAAGVDLGAEPGLVGGVTGALVKECYHADVPAIVLIVGAHPFLPDPTAAQAVIENALEPLVDFDIDTAELGEQADEIKQRMDQIAQQYRQMAEEQQPGDGQSARMYQ